MDQRVGEGTRSICSEWIGIGGCTFATRETWEKVGRGGKVRAWLHAQKKNIGGFPSV